MALIPLGDRIVVKPEVREEKTISGIVLPETMRYKPQVGMVIAIGSEFSKNSLVVKVGDEVIFSYHNGTEVTINDEKVVILEAKDVLAIKVKEK